MDLHPWHRSLLFGRTKPDSKAPHGASAALPRLTGRVGVRHLGLAALLTAAACATTSAAFAQTAQALPQAGEPTATTTTEPDSLRGFWVTTPTPEFSASPGEAFTVPLTLRNANLPPQRATLEVTGLPPGWNWTITKGAQQVRAAIVGPNESQELALEITPPTQTDDAATQFEVLTHMGSQTETLPINVSFAEQVRGGVELEPELPALRGTATSTFTYRVDLTNDSAEDALFNLAAEAQPGFETTFKRGYGAEEITGVPIEAGASETVTLEVKPASETPAGRYPIVMHVAAGELAGTAELSAEVTGSAELQLVGPNERLSGDATAGQSTTFPFVLGNSGSAPAQGVTLTASAPSDWKVTFDPEELAAVPAGASQEVGVTITPSERAIAGDYMVTLRASGQGASESAQFRVTVNTSTMWGLVGLGVIGVAVLVLALAVLRYGRR